VFEGNIIKDNTIFITKRYKKKEKSFKESKRE